MYLLNNSLKNIIRNRGRNGLLGFIILTLITTAAISMIISNTSNNIIDNYAKKFGAEITISPDQNKSIEYYQKGKDIPEISNQQYISFGKSNYLQKSEFTGSVPSISDKLEAIDGDIELDESKMFMSPMNGSNEDKGETAKFQLKGTSNKETLEEFKNNKRELVQGKFFENKNEAIISSELAEKNNLKVGDIISLSSAEAPKDGNYKLKVTGIYKDRTDEYNGIPLKLALLNRRNEIITSFETLINNDFSHKHSLSINAKFFLKNPENLSSFTKELRSKGLDTIYNVTADTESYNKVVGPVQRLKDITFTFMVIVLSLGAITLILLTILSMRERKYEVGVLRAMGMKKNKIALGFIIEMLIITISCLVIGLGLGSTCAQNISNHLLKNQAEVVNKNGRQQNRNSQGIAKIGQGSESNINPVTKMNVGLTQGTLIEVIGFSLILVLLTTGIGTFYITKYEPIKLLTGRD